MFVPKVGTVLPYPRQYTVAVWQDSTVQEATSDHKHTVAQSVLTLASGLGSHWQCGTLLLNRELFHFQIEMGRSHRIQHTVCLSLTPHSGNII